VAARLAPEDDPVVVRRDTTVVDRRRAARHKAGRGKRRCGRRGRHGAASAARTHAVYTGVAGVWCAPGGRAAAGVERVL
jgi:hypothetical protein